MNVYFNAEYTGLNKHAKLISLGLIAENGNKLYIEVLNVPKYLVSEEIKVISFPGTYLYDTRLGDLKSRIEKGNQDSEELDYVYVTAYDNQIGKLLDTWFSEQLAESKDTKIQLISYCSHYDFCLLLNSFQGEIPTYLNTVCYDVYQDLIGKFGGVDLTTPLSERVTCTLNIASKLVITGETPDHVCRLVVPDYPKDHSLKFAELIKNIYELFSVKYPTEA